MDIDNKKIEQCSANRIMRWFGFSGHKWKYYSRISKYCTKCDVKYKLIGFTPFTKTWEI